jgi:hypothetical protein
VLAVTPAGADKPASSAPAAVVAMRMAPGMRMPDGARMPGQPTAAKPSASARMVCTQDIKKDLASALGLKSVPSGTATWSNHLYTCTYHLAGGPLVFSVKESGNVPAARTYLTGLQHRLGPTQPLRGAAGLGLPAYKTAHGHVIFLKDDKTLQVDASSMPKQVGPSGESQTAFAYQMATDVLGCWSGK